MKHFISLLSLFISTIVISQTVNVSGNCFLTGQVDHSGVEVTYQMVAPTTSTYTFTTNAGGGFLGTIDEGVYDVTYHKTITAGYCGADIFLDNYALYFDSVFSDTAITYGLGGSISGIYGPGVVVIACDLTVPLGDSLVFEPGTQIILGDYVKIWNDGYLEFRGELGDSIIINTDYIQSKWLGIEHNDNSSETKASFVKFLGYSEGYLFNNLRPLTNAEFKNCSFDHLKGEGVIENTGRLIIEECVFIGDSALAMGGLSATISLSNANQYTHVVIKNSVFNKMYAQHGMIYFDGSNSYLEINNCTFLDIPGSRIIQTRGNFSDVLVLNTTFFNTREISAQDNSNVEFRNCILPEFHGEDSSPTPLVSNCNFTTSFSGLDVNIGDWVTTNNGHPADGFGNISETAIFMNAPAGDLRYSLGSPGIDCGNNTYVNSFSDLDGNTRIWDGLGNGIATVDMGAYEYESGVASMNDLGVLEITQPNDACNLSATESITASVRSFGTTDATGFDMSYSIDNGSTWVTENYAGTLLAGQEMDYTFSQTADFSGVGVYNVLVGAVLVGDAYYENDTLSRDIETYALTTSFSGVNNPSCAGIGNGTATIDVTGAPGPFSYLWDNATSSVTQAVSALDGNQRYHVSIVTATGCSTTDSVYLTEPMALVLGMDSTNATCLSSNSDGVATVLPTGGTGTYTYLWDDGGATTSATLTNMTPGQTYTVTVADANGCSAQRSVTLATLTSLISGLSSQDISCNGLTDGAASVNPSGGTGPYTIAWYDVSSGNSVSNLGAGSYNVYIEDANGCFVDEDAVIVEPDALSFSFTNSTDVDCFGNTNGSLTATPVGGTMPYSYNWAAGNTDSTATGLAGGYQAVTISDASGCSIIDSMFVTQPDDIVVAIDTTNNLCFGETNGILDITVTGGNGVYAYSWNTGATTQDISSLQAGFYTVVVSDGNGCNQVANAQVTAPGSLSLNLSIFDNACFGSCNGEVTPSISGGTLPYTFNWSNGDTASIASNLCAGTYQLAVTDVNGCQVSDNNIQVIEGNPLTLTITSTTSDCDTATGTATVYVAGGVLPYTYLWDNGVDIASTTNLSGGLHTVTITDDAGCIQTETFGVSNNGAPQVVLSSLSNITCGGDTTGSIDIEVSGGSAPYSYQWSNNEMTQDISGLSAGPYEVTVTDATNCTATSLFDVLGPDPLMLVGSVTNATCTQFDGTASVSVSGGVSPFQYSWSNGGLSSSINNLSAGAYTLVVNDASGCQDSITVTVNDDGAPTITIDQVVPISCTSSTGSVLVTTTGTGNTFDWSNGTSNEDLTGVSAGVYELTVTDINGCQSILLQEVSDSIPPAPPICLVTVNDTTNTNLLAWEKDSGQDIAFYNVYRETSQAGVYNLVHTQPFSDLSQWTDSVADPMIRGWRYQLSAVNSCGIESPMSEVHKTMHLTINQGLGGSYNLIWDDYEGFVYGSYDVYRYTNSNGMQLVTTMPASLNSYTDTPTGGIGGLYYLIEVIPPSTCTSTKSQDHNTTRSNRHTSVETNVLSISEMDNLNFVIYPNPAYNTFRVKSSFEGEFELSIYSLAGKLLVSQSGISNSQVIGVSDLSVGVYIVEVEKGGEKYKKKLVINK